MQIAGVSPDILGVIQAVIVLFIAAPPLVRAIFRLPAPGGTGLVAQPKLRLPKSPEVAK
jgi:simple sugar transport system permease protein